MEGIKRAPMLSFILKFIIFLLIYSAISTLTDDAVYVKRIAQFFLYVLFAFILHREKGVEFHYKFHFHILDFIMAFLLLFSSIIFYEGTIEKLIDTYFNYEISLPESEGVMDEMFRYPIPLFLQICVTAPVFEELLMRGYLLKTVSVKYSVGVGILLNSLFFSFLHFDFVNTLFYFMIGILLSYIYLKTGSLLHCILLHFSINFTALLSYYLEFEMPGQNISISMLLLMGVIIVITMFYFIRKPQQKIAVLSVK